MVPAHTRWHQRAKTHAGPCVMLPHSRPCLPVIVLACGTPHHKMRRIPAWDQTFPWGARAPRVRVERVKRIGGFKLPLGNGPRADPPILEDKRRLPPLGGQLTHQWGSCIFLCSSWCWAQLEAGDKATWGFLDLFLFIQAASLESQLGVWTHRVQRCNSQLRTWHEWGQITIVPWSESAFGSEAHSPWSPSCPVTGGRDVGLQSAQWLVGAVTSLGDPQALTCRG